jgi:4-hydroxybenzoate polyprenyltransferase
MNLMILSQSNHLKRLRLFFALSRTPHGLLDMATPAFAALLWLGAFPAVKVVLLGIITAFAGYTAVYALNDTVDYRADKSRLQHDTTNGDKGYLDAVMARHPLAQGMLSYREGLLWVVGWAAIAMVGAYLLNPVCLMIFILGSVLEILYCMMWNVSPFRTVISGFVKTSGAMAAVFAVDPAPSPVFLLTLFLCLFFWEIGGQNVPADWADIDIDARLNAQTIPVRMGIHKSSVIILVCLLGTLIFNGLVFIVPETGVGPVWAVTSLISGVYLLIEPAVTLYQEKTRENAMALFNRASYYPLVLLVAIVLGILI